MVRTTYWLAFPRTQIFITNFERIVTKRRTILIYVFFNICLDVKFLFLSRFSFMALCYSDWPKTFLKCAGMKGINSCKSKVATSHDGPALSLTALEANRRAFFQNNWRVRPYLIISSASKACYGFPGLVWLWLITSKNFILLSTRKSRLPGSALVNCLLCSL